MIWRVHTQLRMIRCVASLAYLCSSIFIGGCGSDRASPDAHSRGHATKQNNVGSADGSRAANPNRKELDAAQGLTGEERERFYHLDMGGEIVPLDWLRALQSSSTGKPFLENTERFGLLPDPANAAGLPIGLTATESRDSRLVGKMVGLNCAACHTTELTFRQHRIRIDGGAGMFDAVAFAADLTESIGATVGNSKQLFAFIGRLLKVHDDSPNAAGAESVKPVLIRQLGDVESLVAAGAAEKAFVEHLESLVEVERPRPVPEPSSALSLKHRLEQTRQDVKSRVGEILHGDLRGILQKDAGAVFSKIEDRESAMRGTIEHVVQQVRLMKARLEFLKKMNSLRDLPTTEAGPGRADDFATARNALFDKQFAIPSTAPCSIPPLWGTSEMTWTDWDGNTTSAMGRSMATALAGGASFDPETFVSTVSPRTLFEFEELVRKMQPPVWPAEILGPIDRTLADRGAPLFRQHCARCHPTEPGPPQDLLFDLKEMGTDPSRAENFTRSLGERPFADALRDVIQRYLERANREHEIAPEEAEKMATGHPNQWRSTGKYASRRLSAVWATAPYLHNGSVPTLDDLLRPASKRPTTFAVGHSEFDPIRVGLSSTARDAAKFVLDTSKPGNANTGHEFGTDLSDSERHAIIEYLKTQ